MSLLCELGDDLLCVVLALEAHEFHGLFQFLITHRVQILEILDELTCDLHFVSPLGGLSQVAHLLVTELELHGLASSGRLDGLTNDLLHVRCDLLLVQSLLASCLD